MELAVRTGAAVRRMRSLAVQDMAAKAGSTGIHHSITSDPREVFARPIYRPGFGIGDLGFYMEGVKLNQPHGSPKNILFVSTQFSTLNPAVIRIRTECFERSAYGTSLYSRKFCSMVYKAFGINLVEIGWIQGMKIGKESHPEFVIETYAAGKIRSNMFANRDMLRSLEIYFRKNMDANDYPINAKYFYATVFVVI